MFDYQRDPKGNGGVALLYAWGLLGKMTNLQSILPSKPTWNPQLALEDHLPNGENMRKRYEFQVATNQVKSSSWVPFYSFHGRRSLGPSVRCHAVLSCHRIQQVHACLPAGRFLTGADDGTQKFLRSDRLQTSKGIQQLHPHYPNLRVIPTIAMKIHRFFGVYPAPLPPLLFI